MNIAERSTNCETSFTRYVRTSLRLEPFSMAASDVFRRSKPGPLGAAGGCAATTSAMARPISPSSMLSS